MVIEEHERPAWARGIVWNCRDPNKCVPVTRSTRHTDLGESRGVRSIDRAAMRRIAQELGWGDDDILGQVGEGGAESRSECEALTVLAFHHPGLTAEPAAAVNAVAAHIREGWVDAPRRHLPFVPCRLLPRDIIQQDRTRVVKGKTDSEGRPVLEAYLKPRVTTNGSHGGVDAVNHGVPAAERAVALPRVQWLARGAALVDTACSAKDGGSGARAQGYCVDAESAYSFIPIQVADLWQQCFLWWDGDGVPGVCVDNRMGFGGAFAPNRFERVSTLVAAYVQSLQDAFDRAQPPVVAPGFAPVRMGRWLSGEEVGHPASYRMVYIDDLTGSALDDTVVPPAEVSGITIDPLPTIAAGGSFAPPNTRVHVHAQLAVIGLRAFGLVDSQGKVVVGDPVDVLGFTLDCGRMRLRCPVKKREVMLATLQAAKAAAPAVEVAEAKRLVGRLVNLSQIMPELKQWLHGGYAVTSVGWTSGGRRRAPTQLQLAPNGLAHTEWAELLDVAVDLLEVNEGVPAAPRTIFASDTELGSALCVTDASGDDGVGGFVFLADRPREVWLVSESWPDDIKRARACADEKTAERVRGVEGALSMPAAEMFGAWAVPAAAAQAAGWSYGHLQSILAVGDCAPVGAAIDSGCSGSAQIRRLLRASRALCQQWLGVDVPREANRDADRLSHPKMLEGVLEDARKAGLLAHVARVPEAAWDVLREACKLPMQREARGLVGKRGRQ